jgi:hypothetical protein
VPPEAVLGVAQCFDVGIQVRKETQFIVALVKFRIAELTVLDD